MLGVMPPGLPEACEEIIELRRKVARLELVVRERDERHARTRQAFIDEAVERAFWQRAAEQALRMWGRAEDELEELRPCEH